MYLTMREESEAGIMATPEEIREKIESLPPDEHNKFFGKYEATVDAILIAMIPDKTQPAGAASGSVELPETETAASAGAGFGAACKRAVNSALWRYKMAINSSSSMVPSPCPR
jgi:hypothetical protein